MPRNIGISIVRIIDVSKNRPIEYLSLLCQLAELKPAEFFLVKFFGENRETL